MLRSTTVPSRLYLTEELRASDLTKQSQKKTPSKLFSAGLKRFPPVEDVVVVLERTASRVSAA